MRRFAYFLFAAILIGCSGGGNDEKEVEIPKKQVKFKTDNLNLVGVWQATSGQLRIISFSEDNLFSGVLDKNTIDDGDYSITGDTIFVKNTYHGYNIRIELVSARDDKIFCRLKYLGSSDYGGMSEKEETVEFKKTEDEACSKHNFLVGKNIEVNTSHNNVVWDWDLSVIQHNFMTFALKLNQSSIVKYTGTVHYFYLHPMLYFTIYESGEMWITNIFKPVNKRVVEIDSKGRIKFKIEQ